MLRNRLSRSLEQGVNSYLKKNTFRKTMIYFGLLISSLISENELIHVFNCFKINGMTAHKSESRSTFVKKILFIYNITWLETFLIGNNSFVKILVLKTELILSNYFWLSS